MAQGRAPQIDEIEASLLAAQTGKNLIEEKYAPEIFSKASYAETNEKPVIEFIPVFTPVKHAHVGLRKNWSKGVDTQVLATVNQQSAFSPISGSYNNVTTTVLSFTVQLDLWKNLFGRINEAEKQNATLENERARLERDIKTRVFSITLRRIYWSLVATAEQLKITEGLKVTSLRQVNESKRRLRNSIGDEGEVARYESQFATRSSQVTFLNYQKQNLLKELKNLLPELGAHDLELGEYDISQAISEVVHCSEVIIREPSIPYQNTKYDEMVSLIREIKNGRRIMNDRYSDVDVKLFGTVKSTGVGSDKLGTADYKGSYGDAYRDMRNNNRSGYEAGVNITIPLGDAKERTQKSRTLYDEKLLKARMEQSEAQVVSTHTQLAKSMALIKEVIATQRMGTAALEKRLKVVKRKYEEARISVNDMILDQDALLNSELSTVEAQLQAVNVILDYLSIFTETPCAFNRI